MLTAAVALVDEPKIYTFVLLNLLSRAAKRAPIRFACLCAGGVSFGDLSIVGLMRDRE